MFRLFTRLCAATALAVVAAALVFWWRGQTAADRKIADLTVQKRELEQVVSRLSAQSRMADLIVTGQAVAADGKTDTTLLFVEYDRAGRPLRPREMTVRGRQVHVDASVIEFEQDLVMKGDPLRGHAIALFTRIYGNEQAPSAGVALDTPGGVPRFYCDGDSPASKFEQNLWQQFWTLHNSPDAQREAGVKVAVGKGVWGDFLPGTLYTLTLGSDGNLSRTSEPIRGVYGAYIDMLRKNAKTQMNADERR